MADMLRAFPLTGASILSTNAAETVAVYNPATGYVIGDLARRDETGRIYVSLVDSNTGNTPESSSTQWADYGPTNKMAVIDDTYATQSTRAASLTYSFQGEAYVDTVALLNLAGSSAQITVKDSAAVTIYDETHSLLDDDLITDIWAYFYEEIVNITDLYVPDIPAVADPVIDIEVTGATASIGLFRAGLNLHIGGAQYGSTAGQTRYSIPNFDAYGNYSPTIRRSAKRGNYDLFTTTGLARGLFKVFADLDITPTVFRMAGDDPRGISWAFIKDYEFTWSYPAHDRYRLTLEGLT